MRYGTGNVTLIAIAMLAAIPLLSQTPAQNPAFEVASVKPTHSDTSSLDTTAGRFVATGLPLRMLLREAYNLMDAQIAGGPSWINADRWDIEGKAAMDDTRQINQMVQSLIEERFQLKFHREIREIPVYELTVVRGGPKMNISPNPNPPRGRMGRGSIEGTGWSVSNLIKFLSQQLDRPLIDKTNLTGLYDMKLQWSPALGRRGGAASDQPDLFTAIQEQLGLKLDATKGPVEVLVIDSVQKPTEN